jgi:hypothetical protein
MKSIDSDNPKYDAMFPEHILSRARQTERWIREASGLRVLAKPRRMGTGLIQLEEMGCAIVPPPRFQLQRVQHGRAYFVRVSLAGTDGLQQLAIEVRQGATRALVEGTARAAVAGFDMEELAFERLPNIDKLTIAVVDGEREHEQLRAICAGFSTSGNQSVVMTLITTPSQLVEHIIPELVDAARTFEMSTRPAWKV